MTPEEYFDSQAHFNKWLKQLTTEEQIHIKHMLVEYAAITLHEFGDAIGLPQSAEKENNFAEGLG